VDREKQDRCIARGWMGYIRCICPHERSNNKMELLFDLVVLKVKVIMLIRKL
jgi:hypothetical protein